MKRILDLDIRKKGAFNSSQKLRRNRRPANTIFDHGLWGMFTGTLQVA